MEKEKVSNKELGNNFEKEFAEILKEKGYWVTFLSPKQHIGSQPCDLIAIKNNEQLLIDCKTCKTNIFPVSRIEQNQRLAYKKYKSCGNTNYFLAIKFLGKIYMINMEKIDFSKKYIDLEREMYI